MGYLKLLNTLLCIGAPANSTINTVRSILVSQTANKMFRRFALRAGHSNMSRVGYVCLRLHEPMFIKRVCMISSLLEQTDSCLCTWSAFRQRWIIVCSILFDVCLLLGRIAFLDRVHNYLYSLLHASAASTWRVAFVYVCKAPRCALQL